MKPTLTLAAIMLLSFTHLLAYLKGRDTEARLTLDAYQTAIDATVLANAYRARLAESIGLSEIAVLACLADKDPQGWETTP